MALPPSPPPTSHTQPHAAAESGLMSRTGAPCKSRQCRQQLPHSPLPELSFRKLRHTSAAGPPRPALPVPTTAIPSQPSRQFLVPLLPRQPLIAQRTHCSACPQSLGLPEDQSHTWSRGEEDSSVTRGLGAGGGRDLPTGWRESRCPPGQAQRQQDGYCNQE